MRHDVMFSAVLCTAACCATVLFTGCATFGLQTEASTSGIRAAEEKGAAEVPQAALHLQLAKEELQQAKNLASRGDKKKAVSMLMRAEADAELAVALSVQESEKNDAKEAIERVRALLKENIDSPEEQGYEADRSTP